MNVLKRSSSTINIATYWENHQLDKYNYDPLYQRTSEAWSPAKRSFLIDTILKNFPMPPIFLHQIIDPDSGKTIYDVIDGKQRLNAIKEFITNNIKTPDDFSSDNFGSPKLDGIYFKDLENPEISDWKKVFWRYEITIEYIDTEQIAIVNNIFDRLNRNGEPLTRQELRNARYHSTELYKLIKYLSSLGAFKKFFEKIEVNRLEHEEFTSELLLMLLENQVLNGDNPDQLDILFEKYAKQADSDSYFRSAKDQFIQITKVFNDFNIDYDNLKLYGPSHIHAWWGFAWIIITQNLNIEELDNKLNDFFIAFRNGEKSEFVQEYRTAMSAGTKAKSRRVRRINALLHYCGYNVTLN